MTEKWEAYLIPVDSQWTSHLHPGITGTSKEGLILLTSTHATLHWVQPLYTLLNEPGDSQYTDCGHGMATVTEPSQLTAPFPV